MEKPGFKDATRAQASLLAPLEKKCLIWFARHMPAWINSDHLTIIGIMGMLLAGVSYWLARWNRNALLLAIFFLAVNWFGDSMDGTLARVRQKLRPRYGFYVDHVVDAFGQFFLLGGLGLSGYMSPWVAMGFLIVFYVLSIEVYLATYCLGTFHLSHWKLSPTELRVLLAIGNIALFYHPRVTIAGGRYLLFDVGGVAGMVGMTLMLLVAVWRHTRTLYREEPV